MEEENDDIVLWGSEGKLWWVKDVYYRGWKMARWIQLLLCNYEDLSSNHSTYKSWKWWQHVPVTSALWVGWRQGDLGGSPAGPWNQNDEFQVQWDPVSKHQVGEKWRTMLLSTSGLHVRLPDKHLLPCNLDYKSKNKSNEVMVNRTTAWKKTELQNTLIQKQAAKMKRNRE